MVFSYLKKLILIPIPVLLVFGFFCHTSFAQDFVSHNHTNHAQHEQGTHTSDCGTPNAGCLMKHNHEQLTIAVVQNSRSADQKIKKTPDTTPVFLLSPYIDDVGKSLNKQILFVDEDSPGTTLYHNWPVGLARSHLS